MKAGDLGCLWIVVGPAAAVLLIVGAAIAACVTVLVIAAVLAAASAAAIALFPPLLIALALAVLGVMLRRAVRGGAHGWTFVENTTRRSLAGSRNSFPMLGHLRGRERLTPPHAVLRPIGVVPASNV